ncbi:PepSY domain-containing protein [Methylobacterium sp. WSM2598]|uniref:PepSY domain-containing protein n=1 Tax=Methylobacterium sp. WSM2598 TaxID=398261 RepID=UPI00035D290F|nr:PepSY domain-containing protein [Methylobacterium sp. WSM2598]
MRRATILLAPILLAPILLALCAALPGGPAAADGHCRVPLADWQPRAALQRRLEAEGWSGIAIRVDDGCYRVRATNARGQRLDEKFDPARLEPARRDAHGDDEE